ncbi:methylcobamide:CoM methyltransferase MtbA [Clostridium cellulovorans]|uniref:Uroporphyrinogen decarboxylase (URO-D) n=1 Tax=Clostridium cellulovorans (strain ATCC 35296 / DSM 3052 / OCM 3 / 743B) TaxID=573061 RepID=D9SUU9_CLOC7|nr:methylcobamide--CoM methyltransferase [Clostridium cellulovorans]ADL51004.1 Uroporphyrinogen decarboxylase (URO-D) [Clostridium cellulovorans 743B]
MSVFTPKERLKRVLNKEKVDRPPVICPGGMMNAAIVEVMQKTGNTLPAAHSEESLMTDLSADIQSNTGFENFGIPFCMTVEAEVLGSPIDFGTLECEPKIQREIFSSVSKVEYRKIDAMLRSGRVDTIIQTGYKLSKKNSDVPVIGSLTGPISTAASIVDPMTFLKELRKDKNNAHKTIDYITNFLIEYAKLMIDNGVNVISIADPTATGEILGPKVFEEYALAYLNKIVDSVHEAGAQAIIHICGKMDSVNHLIPKMRANAISTDAFVNLRDLKGQYSSITTMGNLSTFALEFGDDKKVSELTNKLLRDEIDIIAPACGLSTSTSLNNILAMTNTVKES